MGQKDHWHKVADLVLVMAVPYGSRAHLLLMYRTLSELRDTINLMIKNQGENAPCAAFVFTGHDVFEYNEETNQDDYFSTLFTQDVLCDVGGSSYIYEQVGEMIDDAIRLRKGMAIYQPAMSDG